MSAHRNDIFCGGVWISQADAQRVFIDEAPKVSDEQAQAAWDAPHTNAEQVDGVGAEDERLAQSALTELGVYAPSSDVRAKIAEYRILDRYNTRRIYAGHDYGCGQRRSELLRRYRELDSTAGGDWWIVAVTDDELLAALYRVGTRRHARQVVDSQKWGWSAGARATVRTWERIEAELAESGNRKLFIYRSSKGI